MAVHYRYTVVRLDVTMHRLMAAFISQVLEKSEWSILDKNIEVDKMSQFSRMNQTDYAKHRRRKRDYPTGGYLVCPGSFFPCREGVLVEGKFIHVVEVKKRNAHHAMCDHCGIQFTLNGHMWKHFQVLPNYCGSEEPIPGVSLSMREIKKLLPHLSEAKLKAINDWKDEVWITNYNQTYAYQAQVDQENQRAVTDSFSQEDDLSQRHLASQADLGQEKEVE